MSDLLNKLLESEETNNLIQKHAPIFEEAMEYVAEFPAILKSFVLSHPEEFIGADLEETKKNIRIFAEAATAQYLCDMSYLCNLSMQEDVVESEEVVEESESKNTGLEEYL